MIGWITILLACQFAGEALAAALNLPVPGPVCGMGILFSCLLASGSLPEGLGQVSDGLLANLSLLFVPAGAGVMLNFTLLGKDWLPLAVSVLVSTGVTIALVSLVMERISDEPDSQRDVIGHD